MINNSFDLICSICREPKCTHYPNSFHVVGISNGALHPPQQYVRRKIDGKLFYSCLLRGDEGVVEFFDEVFSDEIIDDDDKSTYRPLPKSVTIRNSKIEGLGLFATRDIGAGESIGVTHIKVDRKWVRTPLGGFYNHSNKPNCSKFDMLDCVNDREFKKMVAQRNISKGEEITVSYTLYRI